MSFQMMANAMYTQMTCPGTGEKTMAKGTFPGIFYALNTVLS